MSLNRDLKNGILISAVGKYSYYIIQFILLAILSRILTPNEFGVVAIVNVFLIFFTLLVDLGIGPAIIQNKHLKPIQISSIFNFSIIISLIMSIIFAFLAKPIALFYNNISLIHVCLVMTISLFTSGLNMVPQAVVLKRKDFLTINVAQIVAAAIGGVVGVVLAFEGFSYFSLIINTIIRNIVVFLIIFPKSRIKLTVRIRLADIKMIYSFSKNQFLFNFINYFSRNLDNILIGKFMSTRDLAYYDKAYTLSLYPNQVLASVVNPVIQPLLSDYEKKKNIIKKTYLTISYIFALIGMPLTVYLFFSSKEIIYILFGSQWMRSVATFQILSISIWLQMIASGFGAIFQSANRTELLLLSGVLSTILNISGIFLGVLFGKIEYVALMLVISFLINFIQSNYLLMVTTFQSKQIEFYKSLRDPVFISLIIIIFMLCLNFALPKIELILSFLIKTVLSLILFIIGIVFTGNMSLLCKIFGLHMRREKNR
jgi:PST family polysaccharide transporter